MWESPRLSCFTRPRGKGPNPGQRKEQTDMKRTTLLILFVLSLCILPLPPATKALARASATGDWFFVVVETQVHFKAKEIDDDHPAERRWYISNVVVLPANVPDYSEKKKAVEYFDKNVIEAAEKHGLAVESY